MTGKPIDWLALDGGRSLRVDRTAPPFGGAEGRAQVPAVETPRLALAIVMESAGEELARATLELPGGYELVVSPLQHYLAVFIYSGQSEVGYELFALQPRLRRLAGLDYVSGEGHAPVFSADDRYLALASQSFGGEPADDGSFPWAELRVHELPEGPITTCDVRVSLALDPGEPLYPEGLRFTAPNQVAFRTPWGREVTVVVPPPASIVVPADELPRPAAPRVRVSHPTFGTGTIVRELDGGKVEVELDAGGTKTILRRFLREE